jgi:hypothetical protein
MAASDASAAKVSSQRGLIRMMTKQTAKRFSRSGGVL